MNARYKHMLMLSMANILDSELICDYLTFLQVLSGSRKQRRSRCKFIKNIDVSYLYFTLDMQRTKNTKKTTTPPPPNNHIYDIKYVQHKMST